MSSQSELQRLLNRRMDLEDELASVKEQAEKMVKQMQKENPIFSLAENLHAILCHCSHTDQCGWHYEKGWNEQTHQIYLNKAEYLMDCFDTEEWSRLVKRVPGLDPLKPSRKDVTEICDAVLGCLSKSVL